MTLRTIGTADFKARLSEHLRDVRNGESLIVLDRDRPIARVVPYSDATDGLVVTPGRGALAAIALLPPLDLGRDVLELLAEERGDR